MGFVVCVVRSMSADSLPFLITTAEVSGYPAGAQTQESKCAPDRKGWLPLLEEPVDGSADNRRYRVTGDTVKVPQKRRRERLRHMDG